MPEKNDETFIPDEKNIDPFASDFAESPEEMGDNAPVFGGALIDEGALSDIAAENAPQATNDEWPRFAMSGLLPVPLHRQIGNNSFGDFNKKGPSGENLVNYSFYPAFELMPMFGGTFNIPYENRPTESQEPIAAAPFDYTSFIRQPVNGYTTITRNASQCANVFLLESARLGGHVFQSLIGFHINDPDRGMSACRNLARLILPVRDTQAFPPSQRVKNGVIFRGPFLDELLDFVIKNSQSLIASANLPPSDRTVAEKFAVEIQAVLRRGVQMATTILNETEAEIQNPAEIKKGYDPPNLEVEDAAVPTDLYCLAHLDRVEFDNKQLKASENIGAGLAGGMKEAVDAIRDVAERMGNTQPPAQVPPAADIMTTSQVEELLTKQREEMTAEFEDKLSKATTATTKK